MPILADTPFFQALTAGGAVRYSNYDLFGSDWNYKASLDWVINDSFRLRGDGRQLLFDGFGHGCGDVTDHRQDGRRAVFQAAPGQEHRQKGGQGQ